MLNMLPDQVQGFQQRCDALTHVRLMMPMSPPEQLLHSSGMGNRLEQHLEYSCSNNPALWHLLMSIAEIVHSQRLNDWMFCC